jgi:CO/xanthine dehydrogenase Mo-binding subunit
MVYHRASGRQANYGDLVDIARDLPIPEELEFKPRSQYEYVGKFNSRLEAVEKVTGKAVYGIDAAPDNSLAAVVVRCPHFGGTLKRFDADKARNMKGVLEVTGIDSGIAVVATNHWYARQAANRLEVEWDPGEFGTVSSDSIARDQRQALDEAEQEAGLEIADNSISAEYSAGFMAHACMEPINATVAITEAQVDVWVSNQAPDIMQAAVAQALGRPVADVVVHGVYLGGGFGRKFIPDAAVEAAQLAQQMGKPVRVIWSREDDTRHDHYRPAVTCHIYGELDNRSVKEWRYRVCGPSLMYKLIKNIRSVVVPGWMPDAVVNAIAKMEAGKDHENIEGVEDTPYLFGNIKVDQVIQENGIPVSYWRSVGHSFNCFFVEGFVDEMADQAGVESLEFRRDHLAPASTGRKMLELAAEKASWGTVGPGRFQGIALDQIKGAVVALVAEVSVENNSIQVHKLVCAADVGLQINPDIIKTVIESCLVWGMSACLHDEITIANGSVQQSNFHDFAIHRLNETPVIEIHLVESDRHPVGVGECAVSPVAPAIANAVFKATRKRLRSLPLKI